MRQKDIYLVNLNPSMGSEQRGLRPGVIISGNAMNDNFNICIVCPISSKIKNYKGCLVLKKNAANGLDQDSEIITFQVRAISKDRLIQKIGEITSDELAVIKKGLMEIMTY